ncbi:hypothetical protein BKA63DRAFT_597509 [Paraphoma chrysanthemicola]|nr:hypothetical protein BKA63DRAFT_597509 [Paraphoma chrysanthemicola]
MLLPSGLALASILISAVAARDAVPHECSGPNRRAEACARPIQDLVTLEPGSFYTAKIRCYNCPYHKYVDREWTMDYGDNDLFFEIALSQDNRTVQINGQEFFPTLHTIPRPPDIWLKQFQPDFSYVNLSAALDCRYEECTRLYHDALRPDYLYTTEETKQIGDNAKGDSQRWIFALDAIGAYDGYLSDPKWGFDNPKQKMLQVEVEGVEVKRERYKGQTDMKAADGLFGPYGEDKIVYDYKIIEVTLVDREFKFPAKKSLSLRQKISRFFGNDVWQEEDHRLVYIRAQWDLYGKKGTLRNIFGNFVHWDFWDLTGIIVGSTIGSVLALVGFYKLFFWIKQQKELMGWSGMDDVWDKLRREREEEENALLHGRYMDEPDEGGSSRPPRYTDDVDTMKPLPMKPLPDKPLPEVPLIDT